MLLGENELDRLLIQPQPSKKGDMRAAMMALNERNKMSEDPGKQEELQKQKKEKKEGTKQKESMRGQARAEEEGEEAKGAKTEREREGERVDVCTCTRSSMMRE